MKIVYLRHQNLWFAEPCSPLWIELFQTRFGNVWNIFRRKELRGETLIGFRIVSCRASSPSFWIQGLLLQWMEDNHQTWQDHSFLWQGSKLPWRRRVLAQLGRLQDFHVVLFRGNERNNVLWSRGKGRATSRASWYARQPLDMFGVLDVLWWPNAIQWQWQWYCWWKISLPIETLPKTGGSACQLLQDFFHEQCFDCFDSFVYLCQHQVCWGMWDGWGWGKGMKGSPA